MKLYLINAILALFTLSAYADYASDVAAIEALGTMTNVPTVYEIDDSATTTQSSNTVTTLVPSSTEQTTKAIFFDSVDYRGNATKVYAWVGMPQWDSATDAPLPAIILVHGGGGMAYETWVNLWAERGYVAIAIDTEGASNTTSRHSSGGPRRSGVFNEASITIGDQFMYHATAGSILANNLMRSQSFVDDSKVGIHGVSWGGVITSTAIGVDNRFAFAIPTYGCGHMWDGIGKWQTSIGDTYYYRNVWDAVLRLQNATMPIMWLSWSNENTFNIDCQANSYNKAPGTRMVSLVPGMRHSHPFTWRRADSYDFADSIVGNNAGSVGVSANNPWCVQNSLSLVGDQIAVEFESTKTLTGATLYYSNEMGATDDMTWSGISVDTFSETFAGSGVWQITATLPSDANGWFINVTANSSILNSAFLDGGEYFQESIYVSTRLQEVIDIQAPSLVSMEILPTETTVIGSASVNFTAIHNLEVTSIDFINESHAGAFSTSELFTYGLITNTDFDVTFDNDVAELSPGESATGTMRLTWVALDNTSIDTIDIPLSVTAIDNTNVIPQVTYTWDGGGANIRWNTAENWVGDVAPAAQPLTQNHDLVFPDTSKDTSNLYLNFNVRSITFDETADSNITIFLQRSHTISRELKFTSLESGDTSIVVASGSTGDHSISEGLAGGRVELDEDLNVVHDGSGELTLNSEIYETAGESNSLIKTGSGTLVINGENLYKGSTIVGAGIMTFSSSSSLTLIPAANGVSNQVTGEAAGTGMVNLNGEINIDLSTTDTTIGNSWVLVDDSNLSVTYDVGTFSVNSSLGSFTNDAGVWTLDTGDYLWTFTESSGALTLAAASTSPYTIWSTDSFTHPFTDKDPAADFDGDGMSNLLEYVLGGDPTINQSGVAPVVSLSSSSLTLTFNRSDLSKQSPAVEVKVEISEDLSFSTSANDIMIGDTSDAGPLGPHSASYTVSNSGGFDTITVTIPNSSVTQNFARVVATQQ